MNQDTRPVLAVLSLLIGGFMAGPSTADTTLVYNQDHHSGAYTMRVRAGEVRVDYAGEWQLYRESENALYIVNPPEKSYLRIGLEDAEAIQAEMEQARAELERELERMAEHSPQLSARLEAFRAFDQAGDHSRFRAEAMEEQGSIANLECRYFRVYLDDQAIQRLCLATPEAAKISQAEFDTLTAMFTFLNTVFDDADFEQMGLPYLELSGIPLSYGESRAGGQERVLDSASQQPIGEDVFTLPDNYRRESPTP